MDDGVGVTCDERRPPARLVRALPKLDSAEGSAALGLVRTALRSDRTESTALDWTGLDGRAPKSDCDWDRAEGRATEFVTASLKSDRAELT